MATTPSTEEVPDWEEGIKDLPRNPQPWPHCSNLRSIILRHHRRGKYEPISQLLETEYLITVKIHGSNIAIELTSDDSGWRVTSYRSRKLVLGPPPSEETKEGGREPTDRLTTAHLNGTPLEPILSRYHERLIAFADTYYPSTDATSPKLLLFHGELHLGDDHPKSVSKLAPNLKSGRASYGVEPFWKPFGTQTVTADGEATVQWLGDELLGRLSTLGLETPKVLFRGSLLDAIPEMFELLVSHETEGGFVTTVTGDRGFKWKDAAMSDSDDQKFGHEAKIGDWTVDQKADFQRMSRLSDPEMRALELIDEIFFHGGFEKPKYVEGSGGKGSSHGNQLLKMLSPAVPVSLTSHGQTLATKDEVRAMGKEDRVAEISRVVGLIFADIWSEYTRDREDEPSLVPEERLRVMKQIQKWYSKQLFQG